MKNNEEKFYNMGVVSRELLNNSEEQIKKCANNLKTKIKELELVFKFFFKKSSFV